MKESYVKLLKNIERENSILAENRMSVFNIKHKNEKNVRIYHRFEDFVESIEKLMCIDTTIDVYISLDKYTDVSYINDKNINKHRYMKMRFVIKNDVDYNIEDIDIIDGKYYDICKCDFIGGNDYVLLDYSGDIEKDFDIEFRTNMFLKIVYNNMKNKDYIIRDFNDRYFIIKYT